VLSGRQRLRGARSLGEALDFFGSKLALVRPDGAERRPLTGAAARQHPLENAVAPDQRVHQRGRDVHRDQRVYDELPGQMHRIGDLRQPSVFGQEGGIATIPKRLTAWPAAAALK